MKVSIITVTFNSSSFISHCLDSVKNQPHNDIEHIVIDGASTDGTLSILKSKTNQLAELISETDNGIYEAMNKGLKIATGDIIGFLNSDDFYINNNVISKVVKLFKQKSEIEACYSDLVYVDRINISKIVRYWKSSEFILGSFSKGWCPPHPTFFVRRSVYEKFGSFDVSYQLASDIDLMMRFLEIKKVKSCYIPEVLIKMRMGGQSNNSFKNILKQNLEVFQALKKHNIPNNFIIFFIYKIISRFKQFVQRPDK